VLSYGADTLSKVPFPMRDLDPPFNTWFLGPTLVFIPKRISIGLVIFAGLTNLTTDRQIEQ